MAEKNGFLGNLIQKILKIIVRNLFKGNRKTHIQHVVPHDDGWAIRGEGNERYTEIFDTQERAIREAKRIAKNYRSGVVIHGQNGRIRDRVSYSD
jgi:hypothetical protein